MTGPGLSTSGQDPDAPYATNRPPLAHHRTQLAPRLIFVAESGDEREWPGVQQLPQPTFGGLAPDPLRLALRRVGFRRVYIRNSEPLSPEPERVAVDDACDVAVLSANGKRGADRIGIGRGEGLRRLVPGDADTRCNDSDNRPGPVQAETLLSLGRCLGVWLFRARISCATHRVMMLPDTRRSGEARAGHGSTRAGRGAPEPAGGLRASASRSSRGASTPVRTRYLARSGDRRMPRQVEPRSYQRC